MKLQPEWQAEHRALVLKSMKPRLALGEIASSLPATHSSKGAMPDTTVRSKVAMALPSVFSVTPSPGYAISNSRR